MKVKPMLTAVVAVFAALLTLNLQLSAATPMGTVFTYQGRLLTGTNAANGIYDFQFAIFDAASGGVQKGPLLTTNAVSVSYGLFVVTLDFGAGAFTGDTRWLDIAVKTNGAGGYTRLTPRQELTPTPYAIVAHSTSNLLGALPAGSVGAAQLAAGAVGNAGLAPAAVTSDKIADGTIVNADIGASGIDAGKIIGGDLLAYRLKVGSGHTLNGGWATIAGGVGSMATGNRSAVGGGDLNEATNSHSTVGGGNRNKAYGDASTVGGGNVNTARGDASTVSGGDGNTASGQYATVGGGGGGNVSSGVSALVAGGYGNTASGQDSTVGGGSFNQATNIYATVGGGTGNSSLGTSATVAGGNGNTASGVDTTVGGGSFNQATASYATVGGGSGNSSLGTSATVAGGYQNNALGQDSTVGGGNLNRASGQRATVPGGWNNRATGDYSVAAGQSAVASAAGSMVFSDNSGNDFVSTVENEFAIRAANGVRLHSNVGIHLNAVNRPLIVRDWDPFTSSAPDGKANIGRWGLFMEPYALVMGIPSTDVGPRYMEVARYNPDGTREKLFGVGNDGATAVKVLNVTGGSDVAEPFEASDPEPIPKGSVLIIDDQHPGQVRLSDQPYDKRVAGVASGANGLLPGLTLSQQGRTDKGVQMALSGRVYVRADASAEAIQPGDLLTTSAVPGHAMKVTDSAKAQGAILGKAMSGLKEGRGLVLVLVTLQ